MILHVLQHSSLHTGRNEEILLTQTKLLTGNVVIVRIKNLTDILSQVFLFYCLLIVTTVECIQTEGIDRLSIPDSKGVDHVLP